MVPEYYEWFCPVKILCGLKALSNLPYEMDLLGARKAMIVTDAGVVEAGLSARLKRVFEGSPATIGAVFDDVPPDSSVRVVNRAARLFNDTGCDCFVALGGGSCLDTAKCANMMVTEGTDDLARFQGVERLNKRMKPFVAIPTTAGTGSEATMIAIVYDETTETKMAFASNRLFPDVAILDPEMTVGMPPKLTAATGMDALTHAVEAYYCIQKNPVSDAFAITAVKLIAEHLIPCVTDGKDRRHRLAMANASLLAGISFSNSLVGVVHALAHACGSLCKIPHGVANTILLPVGMEHNLDKAGHFIAEMTPLLEPAVSHRAGASHNAEAAVEAVCALRERLHELTGIPLTLSDAGVPEDKLEAIARAALNDGSAVYNPEQIDYADALSLLRKAF